MPFLKLKKNEMIKVFGPMLVIVKKGLIDILGKKAKENEQIIIHRIRSYVIRSLDDTELDINMTPDAQIQAVEETDPYLEWYKKAEEIIKEEPGKIMILGGVDNGKSSYTVLLSNIALEQNLKPALIDADVGQADIGPPGFISMAYPNEQTIWMRTLKPVSMRFIGDIKPQIHTQAIIGKTRELAMKALKDSRKPVIIDTDGWVGDTYAFIYKSRMIEDIKPDIVVVIGNELKGLFKKYEKIGIKVVELPAPTLRRTRSREERRALRSDKYREFLLDAKSLKISLDEIVVSGHPLFMGMPLDPNEITNTVGAKVLYASRTPDTVFIVLAEQPKNIRLDELKKVIGVPKARCYVQGFEKNMYVGLVGENGDEYPGIIEKIDYVEKTITLKTKYTGKIKMIKTSKMKLSPEFTELLME